MEAIEPAELRVDVPLKCKAFDIPSLSVVGYGLDYVARYRNRRSSPPCGERSTSLGRDQESGDSAAMILVVVAARV
jgi:hypothetical protein